MQNSLRATVQRSLLKKCSFAELKTLFVGVSPARQAEPRWRASGSKLFFLGKGGRAGLTGLTSLAPIPCISTKSCRICAARYAESGAANSGARSCVGLTSGDWVSLSRVGAHSGTQEKPQTEVGMTQQKTLRSSLVLFVLLYSTVCPVECSPPSSKGEFFCQEMPHQSPRVCPLPPRIAPSAHAIKHVHRKSSSVAPSRKYVQEESRSLGKGKERCPSIMRGAAPAAMKVSLSCTATVGTAHSARRTPA